MIAQKKFHFVSSLEGWVGNTFGNVQLHWRNARQLKRNSWIAENMGGYLSTTYVNNSIVNSNFTLTTSWLSLGVPTNGTIQSVSADYYYRWDFGSDFSGPITFAQNSTGPFSLTDTSNNFLGQFSPHINLPSNALTGQATGGNTRGERHYPSGHGTIPVRPLTTDIPANWASAIGSSISIPSNLQAPTSQVIFKLGVSTQANPCLLQGGYIRLKQDRVLITINYTAPDYYLDQMQIFVPVQVMQPQL